MLVDFNHPPRLAQQNREALIYAQLMHRDAAASSCK